jgi:thioredoxin-related protein
MKFSLTIFVFLCCVCSSFTQTSAKNKLYNPEEDAKMEISKVLEQAKQEGKYVLLQIGGNWCAWCKAFDKKVSSNDTLKNARAENFVVYHLNYSKENKNEEVLASLGYPQRFGFPVFVILDKKGRRIHTQNSAYLEEGKGHSVKKVLQFFNQWSPRALDPNEYKNSKL